jgi:branched-chain amino acid transport system permease protein
MVSYIVNGLAAGGGYALVAVGLSYTIGVARVMNFAFGGFYMLGAFLVSYFAGGSLGIPYVLACVLMVPAMVVIAVVFGRVAVLPVVRVSEEAVMVATLAVSVILTNLALQIFGTEERYIDSPFNNTTFKIEHTHISLQAIIALVAAPVLTGALWLFMRRTTMGTRIRATAQDPELAATTSVNISAVYMTAIVIGVVLAAIAGALYAPTTVLDTNIGNSLLLKAFTVAALAGLGNLWGATAVGILLGIGESVFAGYVDPGYANAFVFGVLIITLLFFPRGIFGGMKTA